eukprot:4094407-Prymnesium_polylepis.1
MLLALVTVAAALWQPHGLAAWRNRAAIMCDAAPSLQAQKLAYLRMVKSTGRYLTPQQKKLISELEAQEESPAGNVLNSWSTATASHILLKGADAQERASRLLADLQSGAVLFADAAKKLSECASGTRAGGSLGSFSPGKMVPEFEKLVFSSATELG